MIPFATSNKNKIKEIEEVLGHSIEVIPNLDVKEVQCSGFSYEDVLFVAGEKAKTAFLTNGKSPVIVEDSALCVEGLGWRPGPLVDQFTNTVEAREALCRSIGPKASRKATAYCVLAVFNGKEVHFRVGKIDGQIAQSPRGSGGFGWDDIFVPDGRRSFAEMTPEEKNSISMRRLALEEMKAKPFTLASSEPEDSYQRSPINRNSVEEFKSFISTPISQEEYASLSSRYSTFYKRMLDNWQSSDTGSLRAAGLYPLNTPFDKLRGQLFVLPAGFMVEALVDRHICLQILTHDALLETQREMQKQGYRPIPGKHIQPFEKAISGGRGVTFSDYGIGIKQPKVGTNSDSARQLLATGLFTFTCNDLVTIPFLMSSMPDVVSAWSLETIALCGGIGFIPVDSIWSKPENQVAMASEAFALLEEDPTIALHPRRDLLIKRAQDLIGATLKANPKDAIKRVELLKRCGVRTYRVYDPRDRNSLYDTVRALRDRFGDEIRILAGQVVASSGIEDTYEAHRLVEAGANALIVGIGEGGICSTPTVASIAPDNVKNGYAIVKSGIKVPVLFDGGVGTHVTIAFAIGAAGVMKSRLLVGVEGPGTFWVYESEGRYGRNYSGEAAARTKLLGGKVDRRNRPFAVEGVDQHLFIQPESPSTASIIYDLMQGLATSLIFARVSCIEELQHQEQPLILFLGARAGTTAGVHHQVT